MACNRGYRYRETVGPAWAGKTLLDHLSSRHRHSSIDAWRGRIAEGRVLVDGSAASPDRVLRCGQTLTWDRPGWHEPDTPQTFAVLHEDADLLAVAKPSGLPTVPGGGFLDNTLLALVRRREGDVVPMHRLGRWTSGIVLFARSPTARSHLARAWRERRVGKRYVALASGRPTQRRFDVNTPIGRIPYAPLGWLHAACDSGKPSVSQVVVAEQRRDTFVAHVTIETGRPHQIRIHLAAASHPLLGDPLYGPGGLPRAGSRALPGDPGYLLHAESLEFEHPATKARVVLTCPPPPSLRTSTP
jgi:23S rRNA pseudouridine1911/1915/1917 synthase